MCVDVSGKVAIRKVVNLGLLGNARLKRTLNRITSQIIGPRPTFLFKQDLRVPKVLFRKSLKQLPIETNHAKGLAPPLTTATAPNPAPSKMNPRCFYRLTLRRCPQKWGSERKNPA